MTEQEYRNHPAWNHSSVKLLPDQPELFHGRHITGQWPYEASSAMDMGTILHAAVLLGEPLPIIPPEALNGDGHRKGAQWKEWKDAHPGPALTAAEAEPLKAMFDSVWGNAAAKRLLTQPGATEQALFRMDVETGLELKGKIDHISDFPDGIVVVDLKTTKDPTPEAFAKSCVTFSYHRQAAWYSDLVRAEIDPPEAFVFITVRNEPPYECLVYECSEDMIEQGRRENRAALADLKRRLDTDDWHSAGHGNINLLDLPKWARREV